MGSLETPVCRAVQQLSKHSTGKGWGFSSCADEPNGGMMQEGKLPSLIPSSNAKDLMSVMREGKYLR